MINLSIYFSLDQPFLQDRGETRETVQEMQEEKEKIVLEEVVSGSDKMVRIERIDMTKRTTRYCLKP